MTSGLRVAAAIALGLVLATLPFVHFGAGVGNHHAGTVHGHADAHHVATGE